MYLVYLKYISRYDFFKIKYVYLIFEKYRIRYS